MEQKWAGQLGKINFFVYCCKLAHLIFLIFHINLEGIKGYKLAQTPFLGKFSFCRFSSFLLIFVQKSTFLFIVQNWLIIFFWYFAWSKRPLRGISWSQTFILGKFSFSQNFGLNGHKIAWNSHFAGFCKNSPFYQFLIVFNYFWQSSTVFW